MRLRVLTACLLTTACFQADAPEEEVPAEAEGALVGGAPPPPPPGSPPPPPPPASGKAAPTPKEASRFLVQASFGPAAEDIARVEAVGLEGWIAEQAALPVSPYVNRIALSQDPRREVIADMFWERAIEGEDQLRGRVAYALSGIVTVSTKGGVFGDRPEAFAVYMDALQRGALGNYEDMIREVTLTPAMGSWLSHLGNRKADPETGIEPDENYAREVMQLFTIGLEELNPDGTPKGRESYDIDDVKGLAAVFTGLSWADTDFRYPRLGYWNETIPMESFNAFHEQAPKTFLGATVDAGGDAIDSVDAALNALLAHPNVAPFVSKQLIQHLVTSNPTPAYVARVGAAYEAGSFTSDGRVFGEGRRGDMLAVVAAILLDSEAREESAAARPEFGRLRDPALRFAHFARTFRDDGGTSAAGPEKVGALRYADRLDILAQAPYAPPSVFGWYRPGYVAPGGWTADAGMVAPEMQLATGSALAGYVGWMARTVDSNVWQTEFFDTDYAGIEGLVRDPEALVDRLDLLLTAGNLSDETRARIVETLALAEIDDKNTARDEEHRLELALLMMTTAPEFAVQR